MAQPKLDLSTLRAQLRKNQELLRKVAIKAEDMRAALQAAEASKAVVQSTAVSSKPDRNPVEQI
jgi:hypothetical protein